LLLLTAFCLIHFISIRLTKRFTIITATTYSDPWRTTCTLTLFLFSSVAIHELRPHKGQIEVARRFRSVLHSDTYPSEIAGTTWWTYIYVALMPFAAYQLITGSLSLLRFF